MQVLVQNKILITELEHIWWCCHSTLSSFLSPCPPPPDCCWP